MKRRVLGLFALIGLIPSLVSAYVVAAPAESTPMPLHPAPQVAIHVSELTQALETMAATAPTPTGAGTSGYQWWVTWWHYFVMYDSLKEALRSDGTSFVEVSDADISASRLLDLDGSPRYPIVFSLASEAIRADEVTALRNYVAGGGFLFVGSSAFTRNPDGTTRGDFALASEMGLHMANPSLENWYQNSTFSKVGDHRLVAHIPAGTLAWYMPIASEQMSWSFPRNPYVWRVEASDAEVIANGDVGPLLASKPYGSGRFIYYGVMQPLVGHGGYDVGMYSYVIFRRAIEWAFEAANVPIVKLSPWQYPYDAAFIVRHDFENTPSRILSIESSAQYERSLGVKGEYYLCTGVLRAGSPDTQLTKAQKAAAVVSVRQAVSQSGASIGSHNGGLGNPTGSWAPNDYSYWHWGPDEALDTSPLGYASGKAYATASISTSFGDIEGWLAGLDNGRTGCGAVRNCPRLWASPFFDATSEDSYDLLGQLGVTTAGEQKISPFPHWTLSTQTRGKRFPELTLPVSEWYVGSDIAQSLDFTGHTVSSVDAAVDFYYSLGALVNLYGHSPSNDGGVTQEYVTRSLSKPRMWAMDSVRVYDWWRSRSAVVVTPSYSRGNGMDSVSVGISGATDPETAIEVVLPNWTSGGISDAQVYLDGVMANPADYRTTSYGVKVRVGATVSQVEVRYTPAGAATPTMTTTSTSARRRRTHLHPH